MRGRPSLSSLCFILCWPLVVGCSAASISQGERGLQVAEDQQWSEALALFERAIRDEPAHLRWRRERVRAAFRAGQLPELLERLRAGSDPSPPAETYELALAIATEGEPRSDIEAIRLLQRAAEQLPQEADVYYRIGLLRLEQERFEEAVEPLERATELEERSTPPRVALAEALARSGQPDRARETLLDLPLLEPSEEDLRRARTILNRINNPQLQVPLALRETYRDILMALAEEGSSPGEAIQLIEDALEAAPECAPLVTLSGLASIRLGQLGRARGAFERSLQLWPNDPTPRLELANLASEAEDLALAEDHLQAALRSDPLSEEGWAQLGRIQYQRSLYTEASSSFRRLILLDGRGTLSLLWLGRSLRRGGHDEEAERIYLELIEDHPETFEAFLQLGHIYRRRRMDETDREASQELLNRARTYYRQALDLRPQDPMVERVLNALEGD